MSTILLTVVSTLGINVFTFLFLLVAKWWKDFMSVSIAFFFVIISATLDLTVAANLFPKSIPFIQEISVPVLSVLAISSWGLVVSFIFVQFFRAKKRRDKVDVNVTDV